MKKAISLLLSLAMLVGVTALSASAEEETPQEALAVVELEETPDAEAAEQDESENSADATSGTCGDNLTWVLDDNGVLTISGTGEMYDSSKEMGTLFDNVEEKIKQVILKDGVTSIGKFAFVNCRNLSSITISGSVTSIGEGAFFNCSSLTGVKLPINVANLGDAIFYGCSSMTEIHVQEGNPNYSAKDGVLFNYDKTELILCCPGKSGQYAIQSSVSRINNCAFVTCSKLTNVTIPNNVTDIGYSAFKECSGITSLVIPESITSISVQAFNGCYSLADVTIPNSVTTIGNSAFNGCGLTNVTIPNSVTSIGDSAFCGTDLTTVTIPNSVMIIGRYAFAYCSELTDITIPSSVTSIDDGTFSGCSKLTNVTIPNSVTNIGSWAFNSCSKLTNVTIPNSVTYIGDGAFSWCNNLKDVYYTGSEEQWNNISIGAGAYFTSATIHYNYVSPKTEKLIKDYVTRLYSVCLEREPDTAGLNDWISRLNSGSMSGAQAASGFIFSDEFKNKNYCNEHYVSRLYSAFMGRDADEAGLKYWVNRLETGTTREEVFNGFALSSEFKSLCSQYGITCGSGIAVPQYGTVPHGACSICGKLDGVTEFVTRMYTVCLNRNPDTAGLNDWCGKLWDHTKSGADVGLGFIFSAELTNKNLNDKDFVEVLYKAFMGRSSDEAGKNDWVSRLNSGTSRLEVFNGFVGSAEFDNLCKKYGIVRG